MSGGILPGNDPPEQGDGMDEAGWHTSSYSGYNGDCVQVAFRKASHSGSNGHCVEVGYRKSSQSMANGDCVEAGTGSCGMVHVRDSKDPDGGVLSFSPANWQAFIDGLK